MIVGLEPQIEKIAASKPHRWQEIHIDENLSPKAKRAALRLNALGSLFNFSYVALQYQRLAKLHRQICTELERDSLHLVMEIPRDHFKSTCASVSAPMWWALPFTDQDEELMRAIGYGDAWITWMYRAHYSSTRTLIASEVIGNARKMGTKIDQHYKSNDRFRWLFPEILPKGEERWNQDSMMHRRIDGVYHGEGTYDFIGVKGALQSRHYDRVVEDDLVGEKATNSDLVMESTIEWHKKLPGAFDSVPGRPDMLSDQLVIGNRWSHRDLNSWIRKNETRFQFITHSAEGDCPKGCTWGHEAGTPIFPEEFSMEKLRQIRQSEGSYNYSAQFKNNPIAPEAVRFKESWLRYYEQSIWSGNPQHIANRQQFQKVPNAEQLEEDRQEAAGAMPHRLRMAIHHQVRSGEVIEEIRAGELDRVCILDPNHSQSQGRSRHAIVVLGTLNRPGSPKRIYLLDVWAKACSFEEMIESAIGTKPGMRGLAVKWRCHYFYLESEAAGQQGWKYYFQERVNRMAAQEATFTIRALKTDRSSGGKDKRIMGMEPIYEAGMFWARSSQTQFFDEYNEYPNGATCDILDVIGYWPQTTGMGSRAQARDFILAEMRRRESAVKTIGVAGY